ncbi:biotin/lipoate--protein ligase family protein [Oceaniglobus roseus]|uniref:biotin/lipoate--protein ligase family protein n=1 Tax=Oceaniglobus roseus TaxID=1737570 RepID=UPI000C7F5D7C|nr:biotin/lipoate--protein ligase family protein [Kandeliimicrobium roseum]
MSAPVFPPLFSGVDAGAGDPLALACRAAAEGCEAGLIAHALAPDRLRAALVLAPEVPLGKAMVALPVCGIGIQNALGVLAPPEVAVHLGWEGAVRLNGGICGALRVIAPHRDPLAEVDWLAIGLTLDLWPESDEGGETPERTALAAEGCGDIDPVTLLEAWARHSLVWLNTWEAEGNAPLHREWTGFAHGLGGDIAVLGRTGRFTGVDEDFGLLLKQGETTRLLPLTDLLEDAP